MLVLLRSKVSERFPFPRLPALADGIYKAESLLKPDEDVSSSTGWLPVTVVPVSKVALSVLLTAEEVGSVSELVCTDEGW